MKKPPNFNFGVYNVLEVTDYGHFVLKNRVKTHCNISETDHRTAELKVTFSVCSSMLYERTSINQTENVPNHLSFAMFDD